MAFASGADDIAVNAGETLVVMAFICEGNAILDETGSFVSLEPPEDRTNTFIHQNTLIIGRGTTVVKGGYSGWRAT